MPIKVAYQKEIHIFKGPNTQQSLQTFIQNSFQKIPQNYILYYMDSDNDKITLSCDEDLQALIETSQSTPKIYISEDSEFENISNVSQDFEELCKKESQEEINQAQSEQIMKIEEVQIIEEINKIEDDFYKDYLTCPACTLLNTPFSTVCDICATPLSNQVKIEQESYETNKPEEQVIQEKNFENIDKIIADCTNKQTQQESIPQRCPYLMKFLGFEQQPTEQELEQARKQCPYIMKQSVEQEQPVLLKKCGGLFFEKKQQMIQNLVQQEIQAQLPQIAQQVRSMIKEEKKKNKKHGKKGQLSYNKTLQNKISQEKNTNTVHPNVICDGCQSNPITGIRYKCAICPDFDYCENCEASKEHNHPFLKIRRPDLAPKMIIAALNEGSMDQALTNIKQTFPQVEKVVQSQRSQQIQTHVFEEMLVDNTIQKIEKKEKKDKKVKKISFEATLKEKQVNKVDKVEKVQHKVSYAIQQVATSMQEICGGLKEDYYNLIEKNISKTIEELITIYFEQLGQKPNIVEEKTQKPLKQQQDQEILAKAQTITQIMGGDIQAVCKIIQDFSTLSISEIIEHMLANSQQEASQQQTTKTSDETPREETPREQTIQISSQKMLRKDFSTNAKDKAVKIAEVMGENAEIYYGITDAFMLNTVNDLIEMIITNPDLLQKHSSYK